MQDNQEKPKAAVRNAYRVLTSVDRNYPTILKTRGNRKTDKT